jgi:hypothetical protein
MKESIALRACSRRSVRTGRVLAKHGFGYEQTRFITQTNALHRVATIHVHATQTM